MKQYLSVLIYAGVLCMMGCKNEPAFQKEQLTGHWEVYNAERNGKETSLLNRAVFLFREDGSMQTNITGRENTGTFSVEKNRIAFNSPEKMEFEVLMLDKDTLTLSTDLQQLHFILDLHRTTTESH